MTKRNECYFCKGQPELEVATGFRIDNNHRFNPICLKCLGKTTWMAGGPITRPLNTKMNKINTSSSGTEITIQLKKHEYEPEAGPGAGWISAEISICQRTDAVLGQVISLHNISVKDLEEYSHKFKQAADKLKAAIEIDTWPTNDIVVR